MKIVIKAEPKEIADLIVALQGQQDSKQRIELSVPDNIDVSSLLTYITNCCGDYLVKENS